MTSTEGKVNPENSNEKIQKTNRILVIIIILLSIALGITLWQFFELRKTKIAF